MAALPTKLLFPEMSGNLSIGMLSEAAFRNLSDMINSKHGHVMFLTSEQGKVVLLALTSNKVRGGKHLCGRGA